MYLHMYIGTSILLLFLPKCASSCLEYSAGWLLNQWRMLLLELSCAYDVLSVLNSFVLEAKVPQSQRAQGVAKLKQMAQKYDSIYEI